MPAEPRTLTPRQVEVLRRVAVGQTSTAIARHLGIAEGSVRRHLSNIYAKLGTPSAAAAVALAFRDGYLQWLEPGAPVPLVDPFVARAHTLYPSTARTWDADMIDECRRPIVELLAGKVARLAS